MLLLLVTDAHVLAWLACPVQEAGPWQAALRALCAIEAAAEASGQAACGQVAAHFKAHPQAVRAAADSPQASVRQRAQKLLSLLGDAAAAPAAPASSGLAAGQQPMFTEDLLGEAEGSTGSGAATSSTAAAAAGLEDLLGEPAGQASSGGAAATDLLAGLDVSHAAPVAAAPAAPAGAPANDLFGGMLLGAQPSAGAAPPAAAPPAAAAQASAPPLDLLGGLSLGGPASGGSGPAPVPAAAPPAPAAAGGGLDDLLGGLSLGAAVPAPAMGAPRANGSAMQPPLGAGATPLGGTGAGWAGAPMGAVGGPPPQLGAAPGMGGPGSVLPPFYQPGPGGAPGLQGLQHGQLPPPQHTRQTSLGSLGSGELVHVVCRGAYVRPCMQRASLARRTAANLCLRGLAPSLLQVPCRPARWRTAASWTPTATTPSTLWTMRWRRQSGSSDGGSRAAEREGWRRRAAAGWRHCQAATSAGQLRAVAACHDRASQPI